MSRFFCFSLSILTACKGGLNLEVKDEAAETGADQETGLEAAEDYTQPGGWTGGQEATEFVGSEGQNLVLNIWYPSAEAGIEPAEYAMSGWKHEGESFAGVAPACDTPRPVMVHSHGNGSLSWEMFYLQEFLSTHGWIIVAPDHDGNTLYNNTIPFSTLYLRRPVDIRDSYDWLLAQSADAESPYFGCVDEADGYVVSGYSFGGYTAYATGGAGVNDSTGQPTVQLGDERVNGIVALAPWNAQGALGSGTEQITVPVLTIGGERDSTVGVQYKTLHRPIESTPRLRGSFPNAGHYSYTPIYCFGDGDGCGSSYFDQDTFIEIMKTSILSWIEHLRGRPGAIEQLPEESEELAWKLVE
jgi:predicted dienelactone hydrolase